MELCSKRKIPLLILSFCIVFSVVFAVVLASGCHEHDCTGEDCPVFLFFVAAQSFLKTLKLAGTGIIPTLCPFSYISVVLKNNVYSPFNLSPVMLKVRFNS
jgi:hypothetical protein